MGAGYLPCGLVAPLDSVWKLSQRRDSVVRGGYYSASADGACQRRACLSPCPLASHSATEDSGVYPHVPMRTDSDCTSDRSIIS